MKSDTAPKTARILLIEDNAADVDLMKYALDKGHFRYELITLKDGAEALAFIRGEGKYAHAAQPGLIVMDLHFPKSDGMGGSGGDSRESEVRRAPCRRFEFLCVAGREKQNCRAQANLLYRKAA
jgi:chemotaxis family two-component system response regulator Rcp1